jgi:IclR family transcriptional regulator, pca regulon regulatory protein
VKRTRSALPTKKTTAAASRTKALRNGEARSSLFVGSVEKAFQVLEAFRDSQRTMSMADIARAAQLDRSATQRLVHTMELLGYIRRLPESTLYGLAPKVLTLSYNYLRSRELIERASPYLLDISRALGETSNLQELDAHEIVFLARFPGRHLVNVDFAVGYRLPAVFTASGRAILSRLDAATRREIMRATPMNPVTPYTETDTKLLMSRIDEAAEQGYSIVMNQTLVGDISVAAAITNHHGYPVAAINIAVPTTRWTPEKAIEQLVPHVQLAATSISQSRMPRG